MILQSKTIFEDSCKMIKLQTVFKRLSFTCVIVLVILIFAPYSADYEPYTNLYDGSLPLTVLEPSFGFIAHIGNYLSFGVLFAYAVYGFIAIYITLKAVDELTELHFLSLYIFFCYYFWLHNVCQIRVGVSVSIFLLSIKPLREKRYAIYLILCYCAVLFHYSSIVMFAFPFLKKDSINKFAYFAILPIAYVLAFFKISATDLIPLIPFEPIQALYHRYTLFVDNGDGDNINIYNAIQLCRCGFSFILLYYFDKLNAENEYFALLLKMYIISLAVLVVMFRLPVVSFRISEFLGVVEIILIPYIAYIFRPGIAMVIFISFLFLIYTFIFNGCILL